MEVRLSALAPALLEQVDDLVVDVGRQDVLDDPEFLGAGVAEAVDEPGLEARLFHGPRDGLAAAVDDDRVDVDGPHEGDVGADGLEVLGHVHERPAELDDERLAAEPADVGQGLDQDGRLGDGLFHEWSPKSKVQGLLRKVKSIDGVHRIGAAAARQVR